MRSRLPRRHAIVGALAVATLLGAAAALVAPLSAEAASFTVTDPVDDPSTTTGSLRWAVANAASGDTIGFDATVTSLELTATVVLPLGVTIDGGDHVLLSPAAGMTGALLTVAPTAVDQDVTIEHIELDGALAAVSRGVLVTAGAEVPRNVTVSHATFSGFRDDAGSALEVEQMLGALTVDSSALTGNLTTGAGGAAIADTSASGTAIVISNTTIAGNIAASGTLSDGAVSIAGNPTAPISFIGDTIESNVVGAGTSVFGAGISLGSDGGSIGDVTISGSTFTDNGDDSAGGRVAPAAGGGAYIGGAASVSISATSFTLNRAEQAGGGLLLDSTAGDVRLDRDTFDGNTASGAGPGGGSGSSGGGLFAGGTGGALTATGLLVENNSADDLGGGILLVQGARFSVAASTFSGNTSGTGAAMFVDEIGDDSTVSATTFSGNTTTGGGAGVGGGSGLFVEELDPGASLQVETSTFSGNSYAPSAPACGCAPPGLSVYVFEALGSVGIAESTFDEGASAQPANPIQVDELGSSGTFGLANSTVVADRGVDIGNLESTGIARVSHTIVQTPAGTDAITVDSVPGAQSLDVRWSLLSSGLGANQTDTAGNQLNTDAQLATLANNGGSTQTMLPMTGSPAIDAGDPAFSDPVTVDQRGLARIVGVIDIGAVEVQAAAPAQLPPTGVPLGGGLAAALLLLLLGSVALGARARRLS